MDIGGFCFFRLSLLFVSLGALKRPVLTDYLTITLLTTSLDIVYTYEAQIRNLKSLNYDSSFSKSYSINDYSGEKLLARVESAKAKASTK